MQLRTLRRAPAPFAAALLAACAGSGEGLNSNGEPGTPGSGPSELTADFQSIQDNIFTPICTRCHAGAAAPEGLQLDAAHSYALLVGVASAEVPSLARVQAGNPDASYLVLKLEGAQGIVGQQMPFGGPYLPQSSIDVIRQWISNGALPATPSANAQFALRATSPPDGALLASTPRQIVVAFSREVDFSLLNDTTIYLEPLDPGAAALPAGSLFTLAAGNPATVLVRPAVPLAPGSYRVHVRGTGPAALADVRGQSLGEDLVSDFTVEASR